MEDVISDIQNCKNNIVFDANQIAKDLGSSRSMNMVILGAASLFLDIAYEKLEEGIKFIFGRKGEKIVEANLNALAAGRKFAERNR